MFNRKKNSEGIILYYTVDVNRDYTFAIEYKDGVRYETYPEQELTNVFYFEPPIGRGDKYGR